MRRFQIVVEDECGRFAAPTEHSNERQAAGEGLQVLAEHLRDLGMTLERPLSRHVSVSVKTSDGAFVLRADVELEHDGQLRRGPR